MQLAEDLGMKVKVVLLFPRDTDPFLKSTVKAAEAAIPVSYTHLETGKKERGVNRLTVNTPKMHGSPHTHIKISIYILEI